MNYVRKKIFLNTRKTKYCICKVFKSKYEMQCYYEQQAPGDTNHYETMGVSLHYERINADTGKLTAETGTVLLNMEHCGAGIVSHEFMHAILWARRHKKYKKQYPIVIKSMRQEEEVLHDLSFAMVQFYNWYYRLTAKKK